MIEYTTLDELNSLSMPEADTEFDGRRFRLRGLTSGQVHTATVKSRNPLMPRGEDLDHNHWCTIALGLVEPALDADLDTAISVIAQWPPALVQHLFARCAALTWAVTPVAPGEMPAD